MPQASLSLKIPFMPEAHNLHAFWVLRRCLIHSKRLHHETMRVGVAVLHLISNIIGLSLHGRLLVQALCLMVNAAKFPLEKQVV